MSVVFDKENGIAVYQSRNVMGFLSFEIAPKGEIKEIKEKGVSQLTWKHVIKSYTRGYYKLIFNNYEVKSEALLNEIIGFLVLQNRKSVGNFSEVLAAQLPNLFTIVSLAEKDELELSDLLNLLLGSGRIEFDGLDSQKLHKDIIFQKCIAIALKYHKEKLCNAIHDYQESPFIGGSASSFLDDYGRGERAEGTIRDMNFANTLWF